MARIQAKETGKEPLIGLEESLERSDPETKLKNVFQGEKSNGSSAADKKYED